MSCAPKSGRFGVVFTNDFADIYRIPDNAKSKVEQLTYTPTVREYPFLVSKNGDKIIFEVNALFGNTVNIGCGKERRSSITTVRVKS